MQSIFLLQQSTGKHVHVAFRALESRKTCKTNRLRASAASLVTTPHSGYHFDYTNRRFFEGWYFKVRATLFPVGMPACNTWCILGFQIAIRQSGVQVTLPGEGNAFAFIYSVEDPGGGGENGGVGAQAATLLFLCFQKKYTIQYA